MQSIPNEMKQRCQWLLWKHQIIEGKERKIPFSADWDKAGTPAKTNDPSCWTDFETASKALQLQNQRGGIGFALGLGISGIDIDDCLDEEGNATPEVAAIIERFDSYTEISPSGKGIHIYFTGYEGKSGRRANFEIYSGYPESPRFFTVTGKPYGFARDLRNAGNVARIFYESIISKPTVETPSVQSPGIIRCGDSRSDLEIIEAMRKAKPEAAALFDGDMSAYGNDHSRADAALFNYLLGFTGGDPERSETLFRQSALMRPKWDKKHHSDGRTYGQGTIAFVMSNYQLHERSPRKGDLEPISDVLSGKEGKNTMNDAKTPEKAYTRFESGKDYLSGNFGKESQKYKDSFVFMGYDGSATSGLFHFEYKLGSMRPGLYVLGAASSMGKTTFALQLSDALDAPSLYFALEQSRHELISKSIARKAFGDIRFQADSAKTAQVINAERIMRGYENPIIKKSKQKYDPIGFKFVIEGSFGANVYDLVKEVEFFINDTGEKPVVFIDYLQLLGNGKNNFSDKQRIDEIVQVLKQMQMKHGLTVFVISSFNRSSYFTRPGMDAFKETGGIEYTADVVLALYPSVVDEDKAFLNDGCKAKKAALIDAEKQKDVRSMKIAVLKNRYGLIFDHKFKYYAKHDYFVEDLTEKNDQKKEQTPGRL